MTQQNSTNQPASRTQAPDPSQNYERAHPGRESPSGALNQPTPPEAKHPDKAGPESTSERHTNRSNSDSAENGLNDEDGSPGRSTSRGPMFNPESVQHSMKQEEPTGWDQAPNDIHDPEQKRHPRTEGKGGVP